MKEKLRQYADYKHLSHRKFSLLIGKSDKFIDTKGSLNSEAIPIIRKKFPDLNMNWLLFDDGDMLLPDNNIINEPHENYEKEKKEKKLHTEKPPEGYDKNYKELYIEVLEENRKLNKELFSFLKKTEN